MKNQIRIFFFLLIIICLNIQAQVVVPNKDSSKTPFQSLNGLWKFKYIPSSQLGSDSAFYKQDFKVESWKNIEVPSNWELQGFAVPSYGAVKEGIGLYRTDFNVSESMAEKQFFLVFDGVLYSYNVWLNAKYVGSWRSSYNRKTFDISKFVKVGSSNTLAVEVKTKDRGSIFDINDCWGLSGIYRDVTLFGVPKTHIKDFVVKTYVNDENTPQLDLSVLLEKMNDSKSFKKLSLTGQVFSSAGKLIKEFNFSSINLKKEDTFSVFNKIDFENIELWTAETPVLYNLKLTLKSNNEEIQSIQQKIGFREISIDKKILKLNGRAVKLRGINHHDIDPMVGRALTTDLILKDLLLIKKANINFIRTSHYPSHPKMMELCDSLGIYVMCEVPFGYGDDNLKNPSFLDDLKTRAKATVDRDKNHPSVIIWSVGNENPLTEIAFETGQYVKRIDDTRPACFPQMGGYFQNNYKSFPDSLDIYTPHYLAIDKVKEYANLLQKPIIATEYAHSLGLDFNTLQDEWELMYKSPVYAGGAVWHFHDQGILRTVDKPVDVSSFTTSVWLDSIHVMDNNGNQGADGIVYANRVPQVDYWQIRKVYAPVKALDDSIIVKPGKQNISVRINNRFDFSNMSSIQGKWMLKADNKSIQEGTFTMKSNPHDTISVEIPIELPQKLSANYYTLNLSFSDAENYQFTEKTYRLWPTNYQQLETKDLVSKSQAKTDIKDNKTLFTALLGNAEFTIDKATGAIKIVNVTTNQLIMEGLFAHVGRKATMSLLAIREKDKSGVATNWNPFTLKNQANEVISKSLSSIECKYKFERLDKKGEFIEGSITYKVNDGGWIDVKYHFVPVNATAFLLEAGISMQLPIALTEMRWIGNGPYPSYPGKSMLDEFGFYHLNSSDLNYQGNRSDIQLMLLTDKNGDGVAIKADNANIAVEKYREGILLSHNALVSSRYNKFAAPNPLYKANEVSEFNGSFSIISIDSNNSSTKLLKLFGDLKKVATPFKPFYHSYDQ